MQMFKNKKTDMYFCLFLVFFYIIISILLINETIMMLKNGYYTNSVLNGGATFTYEQNPAGFILNQVGGYLGFLFCLYAIRASYKAYKERKREVDTGFD
jgi:preprotein translocase subunit SecG